MSAEQYNSMMVYIGIGTLALTILGWSVTVYLQSLVLKQQTKSNKDLESLKFAQELALSNRELKLEILPAANKKMIDAFSWVSHLASRVDTDPDFDSFSPEQLIDVVNLLDFTQSHKNELLNSTDKNKFYRETRFMYDAKKTLDHLDDFHNYLIYNKLFIDDELLSEFTSVESQINNIFSGLRFARREHSSEMEAKYVYDLGLEVRPAIQRIENMIRERINQNFPIKT